MTIEIGKHHAAAIAGMHRRLQDLDMTPVEVEKRTILQTLRLFTDAMLRDMGHDPERVESYDLSAVGEKPTMTLHLKPEPKE